MKKNTYYKLMLSEGDKKIAEIHIDTFSQGDLMRIHSDPEDMGVGEALHNLFIWDSDYLDVEKILKDDYLVDMIENSISVSEYLHSCPKLVKDFSCLYQLKYSIIYLKKVLQNLIRIKKLYHKKYRGIFKLSLAYCE